ncbi:CTD small phosphatase-like protein 3 isoform X1 [Dunckerocampus dactyliophorus]|uniref:CTD small phosphatase-like protein 3 isoform X1 n=2 Tax=Dunckerocampus dactyliophorus TaxID=161453 RepID=UPI002406924E|nr:CTD small phosphatase-like protein 3 isoform X1 [Dunckerocampus dactyliophorus]
MRLRSQRTITASTETPRKTRTPSSNKATPKRLRLSVPESPFEDTVEETPNAEEIPTMTRRLLPRGRPRKRAIAADDKEADSAFKTPTRPILRHEHVLSEIDPVSPPNSTARKIYTPIARFLTPSKENYKSAGNNVLMSPEQGVFGYGSIDLLVGDEDDHIFSPFTFIKNLPSQSQYSQPRVPDIPPKTRSTPEATLVVDLEETLMFSSLNMIDNAEYTFYTAFQHNQYKVYVILRPHVKEFLQSMAKVYELFVYTCAKKEYAEKILDILDPQRKLFRHRLYQDECACVLGHYIKDLSILGRDLTKIVVLDNAPHTYPYHLMNTLPIKSWSGESEDRELQKIIPYMEKLSTAEDFREVLKKRKDHFHRLLSED